MNKIIGIYKKHEEICNYFIVGLLTTIVSLLTYYFCVFTFFNPDNPFLLQLANIISWVFAVTFAYFTNRKYVFKSKETSKFVEGSKFYTSRLLTLGLDMAFMFLFVTLIGVNNKISKIIVQVVVTICNYLISKFLVFR